METMNIALPQAMKEFVQDQAEQGGYSSVSEYVRDLIRTDQSEKVRQALETEILKGIDSGASTPMSADDWAEIRAEVAKRCRNRRQK